MKVRRTGIIIKPDCNRVICRPFKPSCEEQTVRIIDRVMSLTEKEVDKELEKVMITFRSRHKKLSHRFLRRFEQLHHYLNTGERFSENRKSLIGAYFSMEYSLESTALFNPSMIWHPEQSGLENGERRFIISFRATGEGHISSITFRSGVITNNNQVILDEITPYVTTPEIISESSNQLSYEIAFRSDDLLSERIIFPYSPAEVHGIEDARFIEFHDDDGSVKYFATYTAYDGKVIQSRLLETTDFIHFKISKMNGPVVQNKGMALFPRKINGAYAMLSRQDNENNYIMFSDDVYSWQSKQFLLKPVYPWEFVQIGNCGSPTETEAGWVVLSHGVGAMRKYTISAFLLDLSDPQKVIGRLEEPLITPNEIEREGYVPNVVYSCGGLLNKRELIIPYAMSDYASTFAIVNLDELLEKLTSKKR